MGFITNKELEQRMKKIFKYKDERVKGDESRNYINVFIKEGIPFAQFDSYLL
jgi:hypothetical protein